MFQQKKKKKKKKKKVCVRGCGLVIGVKFRLGVIVIKFGVVLWLTFCGQIWTRVVA